MSNIFLIEERPNPTTDLYLLPKLMAKGVTPVKLSLKEIPSPDKLEGATLIFIRYVSREWMQCVDQHGHKLSGVVFFMDDDLFDRSASKGTPLRYRFKLSRLSASRQKWLKKMGAELWLSTTHLMEKYADWNPVHVYPRAMVKPQSLVRVFYHGSASHRREISWLYKVMAQVLERDTRICFEIIGDKGVNQKYRSLPRTHILHPMDWPSYKALISQPGRHIGLAPLLDEPFNHARSYTKYFDITRAGAVGIFAKQSQFSEVVEDHRNGILLDMDEKQWVDAILTLASNEPLRNKLYANALVKIDDLIDHEI